MSPAAYAVNLELHKVLWVIMHSYSQAFFVLYCSIMVYPIDNKIQLKMIVCYS